MADACVSPGQPYKDADTGAMGDPQATQSVLSVHKAATEADIQMNAEWAKFAASLDEMNAALEGADRGGAKASATDRRAIKQTARAVMSDLMKTAAEGMKARKERANELLGFVAGTKASNSSVWMNLKNFAYSAVTNDRSALCKWLGVFGKMEGLDTWQNWLVDAFEGIQPKMATFRREFAERKDRFMQSCLPYANAIGMSAKEFAELVGHYACARHAPEANAHLVEQWEIEKEAAIERYARSKQREIDYVRMKNAVDELDEKIENHNAYIDRSLEELDDGQQAGLWTCGYTNRDAELVMASLLDKLQIGKDVADKLADNLSAEYEYILRRRAEMGTLPPDVLATFPNFRNYVPMLAQSAADGYSNMSGCANDTTAYNPGRYYAMKGRRGVAPDSAFTSLDYYGRKAAMEIASADFGSGMYALMKHLRDQNANDHGGHAYDYNALVAAQHGNDSVMRRNADKMYQGGGMVVTIPTEEGGLAKKFITFDDVQWNTRNASWDGSRLNRALSSDANLSSALGPFKWMSKATQIGGMMVTRFTPFFAPRALLLDFWERSGNLPARDFVLPDGSRLDGMRVLPHFLANAPMAGNLMLRGLRGKLNPESFAGQIYKEFMDNGLAQAFTARIADQPRSVEEIYAGSRRKAVLQRLHLDNPMINRALNEMGQFASRAAHTIDVWNDYFQNMSAFTEYYTLRKLGVDPRVAVPAVRKEMDLSKRGGISPYLMMLGPFPGPTAQSGTAMLRSIGLGADNIREIPRKGWKGALSIAACAIAFSMLKDLAEQSLGSDDNGMSRYDALQFDEATRNIPIAVDDQGGYVRFAVGYGLPQLGAILALGMDRTSKGLMTPQDVAYEFLFAGIKNLSPADWPEWQMSDDPSKYLMRLLTPYVLKPVMEVSTNRDFAGHPIYNEPRNEWESPSSVGRTTTPRRYHDFAATMKKWGMDEQPEVWRHYERNILIGPLRGLACLMEQNDDVYRGSEYSTALRQLPPPIAALGLTCFYNVQPNPARSLYNTMRNHYMEEMRQRGVSFSKRPRDVEAGEWRRQKLREANFPDNEVEDIVRMLDAEEKQRKAASDWSQEWKDKWKALDSSAALKESILGLGKQLDTIYVDAVNSSSYYKGRKQ